MITCRVLQGSRLIAQEVGAVIELQFYDEHGIYDLTTALIVTLRINMGTPTDVRSFPMQVASPPTAGVAQYVIQDGDLAFNPASPATYPNLNGQVEISKSGGVLLITDPFPLEVTQAFAS